MSKIDIYLGRLSHLVQLGLFLVTLWTLYYTVVPLYKSAQIEESLAQKELELQKIQQKAERVEFKLRQQEVHNFAIRASNCVGIPDAFSPDKRMKVDDYPPNQVIPCILAMLRNEGFVVIDDPKKDTLKLRVYEFEKDLTKLYESKMSEYISYPDFYDNNYMSGGVEKSPNVERLDSLLGELGYRIPEEQVRESVIESGRFDISLAYITEAGKLLLKHVQL